MKALKALKACNGFKIATYVYMYYITHIVSEKEKELSVVHLSAIYFTMVVSLRALIEKIYWNYKC